MIRRIVYHKKEKEPEDRCFMRMPSPPYAKDAWQSCPHEKRGKAHFVNKHGWTLCQYSRFIGTSKQTSHLLIYDSEEADYATCKWCLKLGPEVIFMEALK